MVDHKVTHGISLICGFCKKCFDSEISLINHSLNHSFDPYVCNICDETFYFETQLSDHLKCHAKQKDFHEKDSFCNSRNTSTHAKCSRERSNENRVIKQPTIHCAESSRICNSYAKNSVMDLNNKIVLNKPSLIKSKEITEVVKQELLNLEQSFACVVSDECFADEQDLLNCNLNQYSGQPLYECVVCNAKFPNKHELVKHGQEHLPEESGMCSFYDEKSRECVALDDMNERSPKRGCVKIRHIFQSVDKSYKQSAEQHLSNVQKSIANLHNNVITSDGLKLDIKNANLFNSDPLESYCIAYNHETNEFEMFVETAHGSKTNTSSQNLDLYRKNPKTKEVSSNNDQSKSIETHNVIQSVRDCAKNENEKSPVQSKISYIKTVDSCTESIITAENRKIYNAETYLNVEDCNDVSGVVAVVYNDDSNSVVSTYEVCELEVVDTGNKDSSLQSSETCNLESDAIQTNSVNLDFENAVASIEMELCDDKTSHGYRAENSDSLNNHQDQTVNPMQRDVVLTDVTQIKEQKFLSDLFGGKFVTENNVIKHIAPCVKKKTDICHICKKMFSSKLALLRHKEHIHSGEKPYPCNFCDKKYSRIYDLNDHLLKHTGQKPYTCPVCSKGFIRKSHVEKHVLIHSDAKPYLCDVCGKNFSRKDYLIGHRLNHVDNNPFMCSTCDQTFSEREDLDAHREIHAVQVSYVCAVCKRRFTQKRHLERHLSIHTGEKPFCCDICNKQFARKDALYTHQKCHRKEKPHECSECGKSFSQKLNYLRHIRIHSSEKALHSKNKKKFSMQTLSLGNSLLLDDTSS